MLKKLSQILRAVFTVPFHLSGPILLLVPDNMSFGVVPFPIGVAIRVVGAISLMSLVNRHMRLEIEVRRLQGKKPCIYGVEDDWPPMPTREEMSFYDATRRRQ